MMVNRQLSLIPILSSVCPDNRDKRLWPVPCVHTHTENREHFITSQQRNTMPVTALIIAYGEQDHLWHKRNQSKSERQDFQVLITRRNLNNSFLLTFVHPIILNHAAFGGKKAFQRTIFFITLFYLENSSQVPFFHITVRTSTTFKSLVRYGSLSELLVKQQTR